MNLVKCSWQFQYMTKWSGLLSTERGEQAQRVMLTLYLQDSLQNESFPSSIPLLMFPIFTPQSYGRQKLHEGCISETVHVCRMLERIVWGEIPSSSGKHFWEGCSRQKLKNHKSRNPPYQTLPAF